jgi:hypothetical protein
LIKRGQIALPDAIDLYEIAEASGLCASLGAEFVYEDIQRQLTAGAAEELGERPDYAPRVVSVKDLQTMTFPPMRYVLPGLIPEGLTILAARPKAKKSWLMLDLAVAVAAGRFLLGDLKPAEGDVLYLALEDSHRRLQRRLDKLLGTFFAEYATGPLEFRQQLLVGTTEAAGYQNVQLRRRPGWPKQRSSKDGE